MQTTRDVTRCYAHRRAVARLEGADERQGALCTPFGAHLDLHE
ncbi:MAG: hypothetical protein ACYTG3_18800 [Planctomycetota bacterium]|jgi:hypothetical protein